MTLFTKFYCSQSSLAAIHFHTLELGNTVAGLLLKFTHSQFNQNKYVAFMNELFTIYGPTFQNNDSAQGPDSAKGIHRQNHCFGYFLVELTITSLGPDSKR